MSRILITADINISPKYSLRSRRVYNSSTTKKLPDKPELLETISSNSSSVVSFTDTDLNKFVQRVLLEQDKVDDDWPQLIRNGEVDYRKRNVKQMCVNDYT